MPSTMRRMTAIRSARTAITSSKVGRASRSRPIAAASAGGYELWV
jgi:hypothetical protein